MNAATPLPISSRERIRLRPGLALSASEHPKGTETLLHFDTQVLRLRGRGARSLLRLLDGTRTLAQVCEAIHPEQRDTAVALIHNLRRHGLLDPAQRVEARWIPLVRALESLGTDGLASLESVRRASTVRFGDGPLARGLADALEAYGLPAPGILEAPRAASQNTLILATMDEAGPDLEDLNRRWLQQRQPVLYVTARGLQARVGPFVVPGETACYECHQRRLHGNDPHPERESQVEPALPGVIQIAAQSAALEVLRFFASGLEPTTFDHLVDYDLSTHTVERHRVLKVPRCPACAGGDTSPPIRPWMERWDA